MHEFNRNEARSARRRRSGAVILAAVSAATTVAAHRSDAGETGTEITISLSGSTAMRNFTTSSALTLVTPGQKVSIGGVTYPTNANYWPTNGAGVSFQLAPGSFPGSSPSTQFGAADAVRLEWHEQGSVEGILEMANDQIAPIGSVTAANRNPTSGNPTWVNRNRFIATGGINGFNVGQFYATPGATSGTPTFALNGSNANGGQNAVQMAISDVDAHQGFSIGGASGAWNKRPGDLGYGKGNAALAVGSTSQGLGQGNVRHELADATSLNMAAAAINPRTGAAFGAGAWNTAGVGNLDNETVAITATLFVANPGTGLDKLNRSDARFLQATGRLANGADFNVATRDVNSGTLNVAALNAGLDPSFAVGENDAGNGNAADGGTTQVSIGGGITFSNKTSGGSQLRPTIQNARMAVGHLSTSDAIGSTNNGNSRPLRALAYRDDDDDAANGSNNGYRPGTPSGDARDAYADPASNTFVQASAQTIVNGSYALYQNETYVTVKRPDATFAGDTAAQWAARKVGTTGVQGDNATNDVRSFRDNILNAVASFPLPTNLANAASAADGLLNTSFILPQIMQVKKGQDGINESFANPNYNATLSAAFLNPANGYTVAFNPDDAASVTAGAGGTYGNIATGNAAAIKVTGQNYLFGNFRQNGIRDLAAIKVAQDAQAKLFASGAGVDMFGGSNAAKIAGLAAPLTAMTGQDGTSGATKGDLIVLGDYNADGKFDGRDLYALARGAALSDSTATDQVTLAGGETFGGAIRRAVLRKNAALDYLQASATAQQRLDASASLANDPTGANAFNKLDVDHNGKLDRNDAAIVDKFVGRDFTSLGDQLAATINDPFAATNQYAPSGPQRSFNLVDANLTDGKSIVDLTDFAQVQTALGGTLLPGDADFNGIVNFSDLLTLARNYNQAGARWGVGDFDLTGTVNFSDLLALARNYNAVAPGAIPGASPEFNAEVAAAFAAAVPEPTSLAPILIAGATLIARRRRHRRA